MVKKGWWRASINMLEQCFNIFFPNTLWSATVTSVIDLALCYERIEYRTIRKYMTARIN